MPRRLEPGGYRVVLTTDRALRGPFTWRKARVTARRSVASATSLRTKRCRTPGRSRSRRPESPGFLEGVDMTAHVLSRLSWHSTEAASDRAALILERRSRWPWVCSPASAAWPGLNGRIAATQDPRSARTSGRSRATGAATQLTFTGNHEEQSTWAPDGTRIAYKRSDEVFVRDVTTDAAPVRLTVKAVSSENNTQPGWSPDGASIVFRTNRANPRQNVADIWIMDADGANERPLLVRPGISAIPRCRPTARGSLTRRATTAALPTSGSPTPTEPGLGMLLRQRPHRLGAGLVAGRHEARLRNPAGVVGADRGRHLRPRSANGAVTQLTSDPPDAHHDEGPTWSPDGTMVAFTSERVRSPRRHLDHAGRRHEPAPPDDNAILDESPDWQPIPFAVGATDQAARKPCGDLSLLAGRRRVDRRRQGRAAKRRASSPRGGASPRRRVEGFACTSTPHSFDQQLVECEHRGAREGHRLRLAPRDAQSFLKKPPW